jgi:hypothetical protein
MYFNYIEFKKVWPFVVNKNTHYDIFIARPSKYGNPYSCKEKTLAKYKTETKIDSLVKYEQYIRNDVEMLAMVKKELKGKVLGCFCGKGEFCHGHILAWIANFED